ncbi:MAG: L-threonine 3-dehydrogenase [Elusimicrobia bacterium]|nr:L-threonine 3-dehydrogenase [Elusimicrobiota bacterium]
MKAICKIKAGVGAQYVDCEAPRLKPDEILLKVYRSSICGSDLPIYYWSSWAPQRLKLPLVFGHEFCGEVEEVGSSTRGFARGDFVSVESHIYCGLCYQCQNGQRHVCKNMKIIGVDAPGGFSQYAVVPARCAWKHSDSSLKEVGSLMEPLGNAVYAVLVEEVVSRSVLVLGCGPQGLFAIAVAKASGAKPVVAVEASGYRRKLAEKMGADAVLDPSSPDILKKILKACGSADGVDTVIEMSGSPKAVELALKSVRNGGRVTAFGIPSEKLTIDWAEDVIFKGIRIYGIVGREIFQTWYKTESLLKSKAIDLTPSMTHTFSLKEFDKAFHVLSSPEKKCGKVLLVP